MSVVPELLDDARGAALIGDTGDDSNALRTEVKARRLKPVIRSKPERHRAIPNERRRYGLRCLVEVFACARWRLA